MVVPFVHSLRGRRELRRARRTADRELVRSSFAPPRLAWRAAELTDDANRLELARSIRTLVDASDARYLPSSSPVNRGAVRSETARLLRLAARLSDLGEPVSPRGVLLVERLLTNGDGPLYEREYSDFLGPALDSALEALES